MISLKCKRSNSPLHFNTMKHLHKCKRSQNVMGMPFSVIISIILIVFFIVVAGIAIKFFMDFQKCGQAGILQEDLQQAIDEAWYSTSASDFEFEGRVEEGNR